MKKIFLLFIVGIKVFATQEAKLLKTPPKKDINLSSKYEISTPKIKEDINIFNTKLLCKKKYLDCYHRYNSIIYRFLVYRNNNYIKIGLLREFIELKKDILIILTKYKNITKNLNSIADLLPQDPKNHPLGGNR